MGFLSGLFHSRDKPTNSTSGSAYRFLFGGSNSGKAVNERNAMQMTAVYACVRILSESIAGLPVHVDKYTDSGQQRKSDQAPSVSASISENAKWSVKRRFQNGTYKLGYTPYGYDWDGKNMIINPDQAAVVKRIFADILSGKSTNAIADELNAEKIPSKKNTHWTSSTIRGILANEKYTGDVIFQKTYTDENFNRHTNYGEVDQYMAPDHHEAIISHSDFDAANALVNQRAAEKGIEKGSDKYQQRYAFSGKIICGECGDTFKRRIHSCTTYKYVA